MAWNVSHLQKATLDLWILLLQIFNEVIAVCRRYFQFNLTSELIEKKKIKFQQNYKRSILLLRDVCMRPS